MSDDTPTGRHASLPEFETTFAAEEGVWREAEWGEMHVGYETYLVDFDDAALLEGLPDDRCQCPHWGYLLSGRMTVRYPDGEDVVEAGEAYYMAPGHTMAVDAGTVLIEFSPKEEFAESTAAVERNWAELAERRTDPS